MHAIIQDKQKLAKLVFVGAVAAILAVIGFSKTAHGVYLGYGYGYGYGTPSDTGVNGSSDVTRLFTSVGNDHHYTTSSTEVTAAVAGGYVNEGKPFKAWKTAAAGSIPVYRLFSTKHGDHFFTTGLVEVINAVVNLGYVSEGTGFYACANSADCPGTAGNSGTFSNPVYRLWNTNGGHLYTINVNEKSAVLATSGWLDEGTAWYAPVD